MLHISAALAEKERRLISERTRAALAAPVIHGIQSSGVCSPRRIAAALNARGVRTARGYRWAATQVAAVLARAERDAPQPGTCGRPGAGTGR